MLPIDTKTLDLATSIGATYAALVRNHDYSHEEALDLIEQDELGTYVTMLLAMGRTPEYCARQIYMVDRGIDLLLSEAAALTVNPA